MDVSKIYQYEEALQISGINTFTNIKTGRLKISLPIVNINKGNFEIDATLVYNSLVDNSLFYKQSISIGTKWKFNFQQYVFKYQNTEAYGDIQKGDYVYIDGEWNIHRFIEYKIDNGISYLYDSGGLNLRLLISSQKLEIDNGKEILEFNEKGYLIGIRNKFNSRIHKTINYINDRITTIFDDRKPNIKITLSYSEDGKIIKIKDDNATYESNILYDQLGLLKEVCFKKGSLELDKYIMNYQENTLIKIINFQSYNGVSISYLADKVKDVSIGKYEMKVNTLKGQVNLYLGEAHLNSENFINKKNEYVIDKGEILVLRQVKEKINLIYNTSYTCIEYKNGYKKYYYLNQIGEVISVLEEYNGTIKSTFKNTGFPLTPKVNNLNDSSFIAVNQKIVLSEDDQNSTVKTFRKILKNDTFIRKKDDEVSRSFTVSFWLKNNIAIEEYKKVNLIIENNLTKYSSFTYIKPCLAQTKQFVEISIQLNDEYLNNAANNKIKIDFGDETQFEITDVKIKKGSINDIFISNVVDDELFICSFCDIECFGYTDYNIYEFNIGKDYYFTINDLMETYKSMYKAKCNNESRYDLHCCNLKKVISVADAYFKDQLGHKYYLDFENENTANFRQKVKKCYKGNTFLISDLIISFYYDSQKEQYYYEYKKIVALKNVSCNLEGDTQVARVYYNEDGTLRRKEDEYNVINEYYYDSFGNIEMNKVYKIDEQNNEKTINIISYNYTENPENRDLYDSVNINGIETVFEYIGNKRIHKVLSGEYIKKYTYNELEQLNAIYYSHISLNENGHPIEEVIGKIDILSNNKGNIRYYKKGENEVYEFKYDDLLRLVDTYHNNVLIERKSYQGNSIYLNNYDKIRKGNCETLVYYNPKNEITKITYGKYNNEEFEQKNINIYDNYADAYWDLNKIEYNNSEEIIYDTTYYDNYCNNLNVIYDEFVNLLHVTSKNDFLNMDKYKLVGKNDVVYQENTHLQNETIYDIILNDEQRIKFKIETIEDTHDTDTNSDTIDEKRYLSPRIMRTNYLRYIGFMENFYEKYEKYEEYPQASKIYSYDELGNYLGAYSENIYGVNDDGKDIFFKDNEEDNSSSTYDTIASIKKSIEYKDIYKYSSDEKLNELLFPLKVYYECGRKNNAYSALATMIYNVDIDYIGRIIRSSSYGKYFDSNYLREDTSSTSELDGTEYEYTYDSANKIATEKIKNTKTGNSCIYKYTYSSENGDLVSVLKDDETFKSYEMIPLINPTDEKYKKLKYNNLSQENIIYYNSDGNISYINDYKLTYGYNNMLEEYSLVSDNQSNDFVKVNYNYDGLGRRISKRILKDQQQYLIEYYYDNDKLICENRYNILNSSDSEQLKELQYSFVYTYDKEGLSGLIVYDYNNARYSESKYLKNGVYYNYIKDLTGNITGLVRDSKLICEYKYDSWGNHDIKYYLDENNIYTVLDQFVIDNNPFRYKGYYYDVETSLFSISSRYYSPELGRFIQPADVSALNPSSINGLNLYSYANNNPIGIAYSSSGAGFSTSVKMMSSLAISGSIILGYGSSNKGFYWPNLDFLETGFGYIEDSFSMIAGVIDGVQKIKHLDKLAGLDKASKWLMGIGIGINVGLSLYNNLINSNLSSAQKAGNIVGDIGYIAASSAATWGVSALTAMIPVVGPFLAPVVGSGFGTTLEQFWHGEDIFGIEGFSFNPGNKSIDEWIKEFLTELFGG